MKNAIGSVLILTGLAACSSSNSSTGTTGGTGGGTTATGGHGGSGAAPSAGATAMSVGGSTTGGTSGTGGTGVTTGGTGGSAAGAVSIGGSTSGSAGTGAGGTGPSSGGMGTGGSGGMVVLATGGMSGTGTSAGGAMSGAGGAAAGSSGMPGSAGAAACAPPTVSLTGNDAVAGTMVQFNDNGGWCWYQDERALVDTTTNKLLIGSVASGGSRNGNIEAVIYDLAAKTKKLYTVSTSLDANIDDHNAPAFAIRPDGKYLMMWSGHRVDCITRTSIFDGSAWSAEAKFDWTSLGCPWDNDTTAQITYSNPWYMSSESRLYSAVRSVDTSPNFIASTNDGQSFAYYGRLSTTPRTGYVAGYYKYWGNGTDRIDFVGTEAHPRDYDNNLWAGYVSGGKIYNSTGTVIDSNVADMTGEDITTYTKVFATGSQLGPVKLSHAWNADLVRYDDGTLALIWTARANTTTSTDTPDLRLAYARFDGTTWKLTYLVKAGPKLYPDEQDYTGLGALDPNDPHTIYISSPYDPRDDTTMTGKREIWRGTTCDNGATFTWTPVTQNSSTDNIRPIVPKWDAQHSALLWLRGTYTSAQNYAEQIVGIISDR